jgi:flagellar FliL protein
MSSKASKDAAPAEEPAKKKKKGGLGRLLVLLTLGIVLGGGGLGAGLYASGWLATGEAKIDQPYLVPRDDASSEAIAAGEEKARGGKADPHVFQASYHEMDKPFTSNLKGGQAFVQIGVGMSTYYDKRVLERLKKHEMAVRSAILMRLAEQDPLELASGEGKEKLRQSLKKAVNDVLTIKEGFGGIEEVFFTSFVTQ